MYHLARFLTESKDQHPVSQETLEARSGLDSISSFCSPVHAAEQTQVFVVHTKPLCSTLGLLCHSTGPSSFRAAFPNPFSRTAWLPTHGLSITSLFLSLHLNQWETDEFTCYLSPILECKLHEKLIHVSLAII